MSNITEVLSSLTILDPVLAYLPSVFAVFLMLGMAWLAGQILQNSMSESRLRRATKYGVYAVISIVSIVLFIVLLPISNSLKKNILKVSGLVATLAVAFSSTSLIRDAASGIAMQFFNTFKRGDYLKVNDHFGRVTQLGLLHTEIQTNEGRLLTLANSTLFRDSFETISAEGAIIDTNVSIGYDMPWQEVEAALIEAAHNVTLSDPFVQVEKLGNHAVTYRIAGVLEEPEKLMVYDSNLNKAVLDTLHEHGIEVASPRLENQRRHKDEMVPTVPGTNQKSSDLYEEEVQMEKLTYEKAIEAQKAEEVQQKIEKLEERKEELEALDDDVELRIQHTETRLERLRWRKEEIEENLEKRDEGEA